MQEIIILGAGTAGTMMANHLNSEVDTSRWNITLIGNKKNHYYQPGFLLLPFGTYEPEDLYKPTLDFIPLDINYLEDEVQEIVPSENKVLLSNGNKLHYDVLIIATGSAPDPSEVEGMDGPKWNKDIFSFYDFDGALALRNKLRTWNGGKLIVHISEMPIKCPVAPLEFAFLADDYFKERGIRDKVEIIYVTPLDAAFTKPKAAKLLNHLLIDKNITIVPDFNIEHVDNEKNIIVDYAGKEIGFDLLVTVPPNKGSDLMERSGLGDELNFVPTNKHTLQSKAHENIFVIGDATDVPTSKAGSVAHFEAEVLTKNILSYIKQEPLEAHFDGHANCFLETGNGKALLIDFNYEVEPVEGNFPFPSIGPFSLMKESKLNHVGKLAFKWAYWNLLLKAKRIPFITADMQTEGKNLN